MNRCSWCTNTLLADYHDTEWGVVVTDENTLFEFLILEGAQAGLSWNTVLQKREAYKEVFYGFNPKQVAAMREEDVQRLLQDKRIIRHEGKIRSAIHNAKIFLEIQEEFGSFSDFLEQLLPSLPVKNVYETLADMPAQTTDSQRLSKELKKREMKYVGATICYSYLQAIGLVDDHEKTCWRA
ncbi:MAG: DNA-3-methyladenine glycosylase I [Candidatus Woesearchaeota archaeon]